MDINYFENTTGTYCARNLSDSNRGKARHVRAEATGVGDRVLELVRVELASGLIEDENAELLLLRQPHYGHLLERIGRLARRNTRRPGSAQRRQ